METTITQKYHSDKVIYLRREATPVRGGHVMIVALLSGRATKPKINWRSGQWQLYVGALGGIVSSTKEMDTLLGERFVPGSA